MNLLFRNEGSKDFEQDRGILRGTFPTDAESNLVDARRTNGKAVISLVAVDGEDVLDHILFSPDSILPPGGTAPSNDPSGIGLALVAEHPDVQTRGIRSRLIREGLDRCKTLGFDYCVVLGSPKYYQGFSFEKASAFGAQNGFGVDEEFMLSTSSNCNVAGRLTYAPEFALFSVCCEKFIDFLIGALLTTRSIMNLTMRLPK